jgi:hypothetical protein
MEDQPMASQTAFTLCRRDEGGWRAVHSTHPWLEGLSLPHEAALPCG